jgi:adenosylcobyric acid synthase
MLCESLHDPNALEHESAIVETGLGFIDDTVVYQNPKILTRGHYPLFSYAEISGYEIHCGRMDKYPLYYQRGSYGRIDSLSIATLPPSLAVAGTHIHGVFDDDTFRTDYFKAINPQYQGYRYAAYREAEIQGFADMVAENLDIAGILRALQVL